MLSMPSYAFQIFGEDTERNTSQLIVSNGYPVEEYAVTTKDSYVIVIQRIPGGRTEVGPPYEPGKPVVLLMSGLQGSSADYVANMPDQSPGYILADHGFDVWLGNVRGRRYSTHLRLTKKDEAYWDFSFDEMIELDLPAQIDAILLKTQQQALLYVGWSQGTLLLFGLLASKPEYNSKVLLFNALAPVAFLGHMKSIFRHLIPFASALQQRIPAYLANEPCGSSVRSVHHFSQITKSNHFQRYDWGRIKNLAIYGKPWPPQYDLSRITAPVALYWDDGDVLATPRDVENLAGSLPNVVLNYKVPVPGFTRADFGWSIRAKDHLYKKMLEMMIDYAQTEPKAQDSPLFGDLVINL